MGDDAREMMRLLIVAAAVVSVTYAVTTCSNKPADAAAIAVRQEFCPPSAPFFGSWVALRRSSLHVSAPPMARQSLVSVWPTWVSAPRHGDEIYHPDYHGWCARHLRAHCRCAPRLRN